MNTKEKVRKLLEENQGNFCSGEDLAGQLKVSRTAIWKAVKGLRQEGLNIESLTKKGYRLMSSKDLLKESEIRKHLKDELQNIQIYIYDEIDSTNNEATRMDQQNSMSNFSIFLAEHQTNGRGRSGKSFDSPKNTGIYMSAIIKPSPPHSPNEFSSDLITIKAAVALILAIEKTMHIKPDIKWVNDLYLKGKKIAGILTEGKFSNLKLDRIIIGIGLNVNTKKESFSQEIQDKAGSLFPEKASRSRISAEIINQLYYVLYQLDEDSILKLYKGRNLVLGKKLSFSLHDIQYSGIGKDINEKGHLVVNMNGEEVELTGGEISLETNR